MTEVPNVSDLPAANDSLPINNKRRGIVRRLYDWVLHWADTPYGTPALFFIAFVESSFFPIPPDVLQIALSSGKPKRSFYYATVSLVGSVTGAFLGYFIGYALWEALRGVFIPYLFSQDTFDKVQKLYADNAFVAIFTAAMTPIPYKVFTIAAGVGQISLLTLLLASIIGRGARFYLVAAFLWLFGPIVRKWLEKYFEIFAIIFAVLLIGGFMLIKYFF
ncbi:MAG: DedA family protein [Planctomycetaceae bacterium]|jgi:membrane protein YqaA with SNARE-associated domain|nr:DedA family protein [Planctomycetaceae bacterium]